MTTGASHLLSLVPWLYQDSRQAIHQITSIIDFVRVFDEDNVFIIDCYVL